MHFLIFQVFKNFNPVPIIVKKNENNDKKAFTFRPPESTEEMIHLGEYMLNVKNKVMNSLKEEIECSKGHLLYLIDVHIFSKEIHQIFYYYNPRYFGEKNNTKIMRKEL